MLLYNITTKSGIFGQTVAATINVPSTFHEAISYSTSELLFCTLLNCEEHEVDLARRLQATDVVSASHWYDTEAICDPR